MGITWTECLPAPSLGLLPAWIPAAGTRWCWAVATRWRAQPRLSIGCLPAQATHASAAHHLIGAALLFSQRCSLLCSLFFSAALFCSVLCIIATTCLGVHLSLVAVILRFWTGFWVGIFWELIWKPTKNMKSHETTLKNHGNKPKTMRNCDAI